MHPTHLIPWFLLFGCNAGTSPPKPVPSADTDTDTDTDADADADTDADADADTDSTGDTGILSMDTGPLRTAVFGGGAFDVRGYGTFSGTLTTRWAQGASALCDVVYVLDDVASSPYAGTLTSTSDHGACSFAGVPCAYSFDAVSYDPVIDPATASDCDTVFGIDQELLDAVSPFAQGLAVVLNAPVERTPPGGVPTVLDDNLALYWFDYADYVGWYPVMSSVYAVYEPSLPDLTVDAGYVEWTLGMDY